MTVHLGSARATLALGGKAGPRHRLCARHVEAGRRHRRRALWPTTAKKTADDYRRKDLFEFRAFNATRVEFTRNGQTIVFERVKGKNEDAPDSWRRVSPNPADADRSKVESLLAGLADMRATAFVASTAKTGLDSPALTVLAKFDDGKKEERVSFGRSGATCSPRVPASRAPRRSRPRSSPKPSRRSTSSRNDRGRDSSRHCSSPGAPRLARPCSTAAAPAVCRRAAASPPRNSRHRASAGHQPPAGADLRAGHLGRAGEVAGDRTTRCTRSTRASCCCPRPT